MSKPIKETDNELKYVEYISPDRRIWSFVKQLPEYQLWSANYWCPDGDGIELYISNDKDNFELECFSGIGISKIIMHDIDFSYLQNKVDINFKEPFEIQCCKIADYFCRLFCEYKKVSQSNVKK